LWQRVFRFFRKTLSFSKNMENHAGPYGISCIIIILMLPNKPIFFIGLPKNKMKLPIFIAALVALLPTALSGTHLCYLSSNIFEVGLPIITVAFCCWWTSRSKTSRKAWIRVGMIIQLTYLSWLHSEFFPDVFLARSTKEKMAHMEKIKNEMILQNQNIVDK